MTYAPLRLFLSQHNISIKDMVNDLGFSTATVAKIRKNENLSMSTLISISKHYNLSVEQIVFFGSDKEYINKFYLTTDHDCSDIINSVR